MLQKDLVHLKSNTAIGKCRNVNLTLYKYIQSFSNIQICPVQWKFSHKVCVSWRGAFHVRTNFRWKFNTRIGHEGSDGERKYLLFL
jgi:hypothetical protein